MRKELEGGGGMESQKREAIVKSGLQNEVPPTKWVILLNCSKSVSYIVINGGVDNFFEKK